MGINKGSQKAPNLRFKGFTDDWEERKLEDLCIKFTDGDWIESKDQSNSGVRLIQTGNVGITEYLDKPDKTKWISEKTFARLNCEEVFPGDILISRLPEPAGRACIMPSLNTKMVTAVDCTIVRTSSDYSSDYLIQYLATNDYFIKVNRALAGGTRQRVSRSTLAKLDIPTPLIQEEQTRIGSFLKNLDNTITLHQRKLDQLNQLKEALLQQMFPGKGETVPRLRFAGFEGDWEERKVKELFNITRGQVLAANKTSQSPTATFKYPVFSSQTKNEGLMGYYSEYLFENAITWTTDGANAGTVNFREGKFYSTNVNGVLLSNDGYANKCVAEIINRVAWKYVSKVGNPKLMNNVMSDIIIKVPNLEEQNVIGKVFEKLDNTITLQQRKLDQLKNMKQVLLQNMFI